MKICVQCRTLKPLAEFSSRSGGRAGRRRRRGTCKACRQPANRLEPAAETGEAIVAMPEDEAISKLKRRRRGRRRKAKKLESVAEKGEAIVSPPEEEPAAKPKRRRGRRRRKAKKPSVPQVAVAAAPPAAVSSAPAAAGAKRAAPPAAPRKAAPRKTPVSKPEAPRIAAGAPKLDPHDADGLRATRQGFVRMRGKTDSGRSYYQEIEPEFAKTLVREHAAFVVNRHTIRRIHSNREFRRLILTRDNYTCHFCGEYGDTIDHLLPRAKGGHTTPVNCVCACNECNQSKADRDLDEFTESLAVRRLLEPTV